MQESIKRLGIMGGTFDPIHYGHLIIAEEIREKYDLGSILFIPTGTPPHKVSHNVVSAEHRYQMVRSAVGSNPHFAISRVEVDREGYSYTVDTLERLKEQLGRDIELLLLIGADVVHDLLTWRQPEKVFTLCGFIAVQRPGYDRGAFEKQINHLSSAYGAKIYTAEASLLQISSTDIRNRVKEGRSIKYLVPDSVEKYIQENELYK